MRVAVRVRRDADRAAVHAFYRAQLGRDVVAEPGQELIVALEGDEIVGALRLCPEAGTLLLRTVVVGQGRRGAGVGRALLAEASRAIGPRECWCFPWAHLERFYGSIGFRRVPDESVPRSLRHRQDAGCIATFRGAGR